ncbi:hypothetical protein [Janibacter melonis]|uniref:hypothetical protein n=1 Tax=Janibacter melonis TaxID=262209 RepID=UPI003559072E
MARTLGIAVSSVRASASRALAVLRTKGCRDDLVGRRARRPAALDPRPAGRGGRLRAGAVGRGLPAARPTRAEVWRSRALLAGAGLAGRPPPPSSSSGPSTPRAPRPPPGLRPRRSRPRPRRVTPRSPRRRRRRGCPPPRSPSTRARPPVPVRRSLARRPPSPRRAAARRT